ncbi:MAG: M20/M25/M40 family metallo-hydrolase [Bdellovibrionia bacterium]
MKKVILSLALLVSLPLSAHLGDHEALNGQPAFADLKDLRALNIPVIAADPETGVGFTYLTPKSAEELSIRSHQNGKCGGFELLPPSESASIAPYVNSLKELNQLFHKEIFYQRAPFKQLSLNFNQAIPAALSEVNEDYLREDVEWLSSFPNRFNKSNDPNRHVFALRERLERMLVQGQVPYSIEFISHKSTPQQSLKVTLPGKSRANEIIVLGGHLDSINQSWGGNKDIAPGADDNASGSANLIEIMRILIAQEQKERTIEIFWYAGEESGLLGSGEIAETYKAQKKDVIAVVQLDMTLFPGSGEGTIASMTDFTSAWLRDYFAEINKVYLKANVVTDKCGYGCSDHASWHRRGYPTLMPFEAKMNAMNKNIHTVNDKISPALNFKHSALYSKLGLAIAMDLGNSDLRQPY